MKTKDLINHYKNKPCSDLPETKRINEATISKLEYLEELRKENKKLLSEK